MPAIVSMGTLVAGKAALLQIRRMGGATETVKVFLVNLPRCRPLLGWLKNGRPTDEPTL
jgi:hypothetical protein